MHQPSRKRLIDLAMATARAELGGNLAVPTADPAVVPGDPAMVPGDPAVVPAD